MNFITSSTAPVGQFKSFGNLTIKQARHILSKEKPKPGQYLLWFSEKTSTYAVSCINNKKEIKHVTVFLPNLQKTAVRICGVKKSMLRQMDPAKYHFKKIRRINEGLEPKNYILPRSLLKRVVEVAFKEINLGKGLLIDNTYIKKLKNRKIIAVLDNNKLHLFKFLKEIAEGMEGIIYKMRSLRSGKMVALKQFKKDYDTYSDKKARHERNILEKIHRRRIVKGIRRPFKIAMDVLYGKDYFYSCFGKFYGKDLCFLCVEKLKSSNISNKVFFRAFLSVFKGVRYCHKIHITHNDIKLENILSYYNKRGQLRFTLADFGLSSDYDNLEYSEKVPGSAEYTPLNDLNAMNKAIADRNISQYFEESKKRDIYSLGCSCYFGLTAFYPHKVEKSKFPKKNAKLKRARFLYRLNLEPGTPLIIINKLWTLVDKMTCLNPERRIKMGKAVHSLEKTLEEWDKLDSAKGTEG